MTHSFKRLVAVMASCFAVSGCDDLFNSSSEPTDTDIPTESSFDDQVITSLDLTFAAGQMSATPADQMPTSGAAIYQGVVGFNDMPTSGNVADYDVMSDITLQADFGTGGVTGRMDNFNTRDDSPLSGSLTLTNGQIAGSGFTADAVGSFTESTTAQIWDLDIEGGFRGAGGTMIVGTANGTVTDGGSISVAVFGDIVATQ